MFLNQEIEYATRSDSQSDWNAKYGLTDLQKQKVISDLYWVVSCPISFRLDGATQEVVGILNLDGKFGLEDGNLLRDPGLTLQMINASAAVAGVLSEMPMHRVQFIVNRDSHV